MPRGFLKGAPSGPQAWTPAGPSIRPIGASMGPRSMAPTHQGLPGTDVLHSQACLRGTLGCRGPGAAPVPRCPASVTPAGQCQGAHTQEVNVVPRMGERPPRLWWTLPPSYHSPGGASDGESWPLVWSVVGLWCVTHSPSTAPYTLRAPPQPASLPGGAQRGRKGRRQGWEADRMAHPLPCRSLGNLGSPQRQLRSGGCSGQPRPVGRLMPHVSGGCQSECSLSIEIKS